VACNFRAASASGSMSTHTASCDPHFKASMRG
jgi:hypothetical protein